MDRQSHRPSRTAPLIISAMESGSVDFGYIGDGAHKLCVQGQASIIGLSHISNGDAVIGGPDVTSSGGPEGQDRGLLLRYLQRGHPDQRPEQRGPDHGRHHPHGYGRLPPW